MRLDASYNLCSKLGSKLIFRRNYVSFSFARPFSEFDCIFLRGKFLKVGPDKIYAQTIRGFGLGQIRRYVPMGKRN